METTFALRIYRHVFWGIDQFLGDTLGESEDSVLSTTLEGSAWYVRHPDFRIDDAFVRRLVDELKRLGIPALSLASCARITGASVRAASELPALRFLDLFNTPLRDSDLTPLQACRELEVLNLAGTAIDGSALALLAELPKLHTLHLGFTELTGEALTQLSRFPSLRVLNLSATPTSDQDVAAIARCRTLVELSLEETRISNAALGALKPLAAQLSRLELGYNKLDDDCLAELETFKALKHLQLRATHVERAQGERLAKGLAGQNGASGAAPLVVF